MVCQEVLGENADLKILATDISTRVLRACNEAVYSREKLENVPDPLRRRWFQSTPEKELFEATSGLRAPLTFARLNLAVVPYVMKGPFDVIFCRNVMIYFDNDGRRRFATEATRLLRPGGYLFIGHAESLSGLVEGFQVVAPSVYQRMI
jgi:chemotaxis protein methyltransferase CheR